MPFSPLALFLCICYFLYVSEPCEDFILYVDRLQGGETERIDEKFSPDFLGIDDKDLLFLQEVSLQGKAYLADDELVIHFDVSTVATLPCSICNTSVQVPIVVNGCYHAVPMREIKGRLYSMRELVRETVLIEVPYFVECNQGKCPERAALSKYTRQEKRSEDDTDNLPFAGL